MKWLAPTSITTRRTCQTAAKMGKNKLQLRESFNHATGDEALQQVIAERLDARQPVGLRQAEQIAVRREPRRERNRSSDDDGGAAVPLPLPRQQSRTAAASGCVAVLQPFGHSVTCVQSWTSFEGRRAPSFTASSRSSDRSSRTRS